MDGVEWGFRVQGMAAIAQVRNHGRETDQGLALREMERQVWAQRCLAGRSYSVCIGENSGRRRRRNCQWGLLGFWVVHLIGQCYCLLRWRGYMERQGPYVQFWIH